MSSELEMLADPDLGAVKTSRRDLPYILSQVRLHNTEDKVNSFSNMFLMGGSGHNLMYISINMQWLEFQFQNGMLV